MRVEETMKTHATVVAVTCSPDGAAALRWAARYASGHDHCLRVVCPVGMDSGDLARVETDVTSATEVRRERAQQWAVEQLDRYLEALTMRIDTPDQCVRDAVAAAARSTSVLVVGSTVDTTDVDIPGLTVVHVSARGRARRRQQRRRHVSA
jgi:hypothetical protein